MPFLGRTACRNQKCLRVCTGSRRDALVWGRKAAPKCAGANRTSFAAADAGAAPNNGTDNVIFAGSRDFFSEVPAFLRSGRDFMKHKQEEYWRPHPDPPPTIQCSWYPYEGQCPYMRLALICWRGNGECTFTDMQKIEKRGEKRV